MDNNNQPNSTHEGDNRGGELKNVNRAEQVRRDTDSNKDFTVSLMDIDTVILNHLESLQIQVVDDGANIKLPIYYGSPESWKSIQRDGVFRDYNGKMILPAMVLKRTESNKDETLRYFNRYLHYTVMRRYSTKNRYTPFNLLMGQNVPVNEVYELVFPDHMVFTYHFIIWTEYVEQMNKIIERINFQTEDYWGVEAGLRFRVKVDKFSHTTDVISGEDRTVKTEFDLIVNGYLLPDSFKNFKGNHSTMGKFFTPKKIVIGETVVPTDFDFSNVGDDNSEKIRNQKYPNLPKNEEIPAPPIVLDPNSDLNST